LPFLGAKYNTEDTDFAQKANISKGSVWYNGQWLKKLGLSEPKTVDEFYDMLVKFRDNDPNGNGKKDEIPLTTSAADTDKLASLRPWIMNAFGISSQLQQVDDNGKVTVGATQENYRKYLEFMEKLYSEKLLDQEVFSQSDDQKKAKGAENRLGAYTDWFSYFTSGKAPDVSIEDPMAYPLSSEASPKAFMDVSDNITTGAFAVSDKCPSPEAAVRWVDYFYSNEGSKFLNAGPEEKDGGYWHWDTNDKGDKVQVFNKDVDPTKSEELRETITPDYGRVVPKVLAEAAIILKDKNDPIVKDAFSKFIDEQATEKIGPFEKVGWPTLYMSKKQQDELGSSLQADLLTYIQQMEAKFISGKEKLDDASWKEYNDKLNQIGVEKYAKVYQAAYDAWKK
jgi:putative aldouronate transport system substrate-binding protein